MEEIWKDIKGYEGLYQVSNLGRVKSKERERTKGGILKPSIVRNYYRVILCKNGKTKSYAVHRLVAETFIPNINNYEVVNHKDENKLNNSESNLEWCTQLYNIKYTLSKHKKVYGQKTVSQIALTGEIIRTFTNVNEFSRKNGFNESSIIKCCRGKRKTHKGFMWKYEEN